jgi:hypothetical protein
MNPKLFNRLKRQLEFMESLDGVRSLPVAALDEIHLLLRDIANVLKTQNEAINLAIVDFKTVDVHLKECDFKIDDNSTRERIKYAIKNLEKALQQVAK